VRARKATQVGCGEGRHQGIGGGGSARPEVGAEGGSVAQPINGRVLGSPCTVRSQVERRDFEELPEYGDTVAIARPEADRGGEVPACRDAANDDAMGIDAQRVCFGDHPHEGRVGVIQSGRIGVLRGEPVVHIEHGETSGECPLGAERTIDELLHGASGESTAVQHQVCGSSVLERALAIAPDAYGVSFGRDRVIGDLHSVAGGLPELWV
jgi:hypothetical protein